MMSRTLRLSDGTAARVIEAGVIEAGADKTGAGEPLLLIHGVGLRAEAWGPQIEDLARDFHVIAVDMPGHGESAPLPDGARLPDYVAWAARVITALNLGPVNVAGHSMGSLIAGGLAVEHPGLVRRVALLNGVHLRDDAARQAVLARADQIATGTGNITGPLDRWFGADEGLLRDQVGGWLSAVDPAGYAAAYRAFAEGDRVYAGQLSRITCPALVLTGDGDANSTPAMTRAMAAMMPQGRPHVITGHRHMVNLTAPDAVSAALRDWLQRPGGQA